MPDQTTDRTIMILGVTLHIRSPMVWQDASIPELESYLADTEGDDREYDPANPPPHEGINDNEKDVAYNEMHGRGGYASTESEDQECSLGWPERANQARLYRR